MERGNVISYIDAHRQNAERLLSDVIKINSAVIDHGLSGQEEKAQLHLKEYLESMGLKTKLSIPTYERISKFKEYSPGHSYKERPNLVAELKGCGGGRSLILNGHIDTMQPAYRESWTHDPYAADIVDDVMYGVGACDMKAGVCAMIFALKAVSIYTKLKGDVTIQSVVDEEGGGNGTLDLVAQGLKADGAIITEPTSLQVQPASRGVLLAEVAVKGKAIHACLKWEGVNAIDKALIIKRAMDELEQKWLAQKTHPTLPRPTVTLGKIEGGVAGSAVPGECHMYFDIKYLPTEYDLYGKKKNIQSEMIKNEVLETIARACASDEWLSAHKPKVTFYQHCEPHEVDESFPLVDILMQNMKFINGEATLSGFPAGCDARHLGAVGIPAIVFGPGELRHAHSVDEQVRISDYITAIKVLALAIMDWCDICD